MLTPWALQPLHHFTPSEQISPSLLHHFTSLGSPTLSSFYAIWTNYPSLLHHFTPPPPLAAQLLPHFTPSGQISPSLLHHFTPLGSPPLSSFYALWTNYPSHLHNFTAIITPLAAQLLPHFTPLNKIPPHSHTILFPRQPSC